MNAGGSWALRPGFYPILDLGFTSGHYGNGYMEISYGSGNVGEISGTSKMVRELFTVTGGTRTITSVGLRVLRGSGTDALIVTLEDSGGSTIASASIPYSSVETGNASNYDTSGKGKYVETALSATLTNGSTYRLRLSTASGSTYWAFVIRQGSSFGYDAATYFSDGVAQKTTDGSDWSSLGVNADQNDLQFYLDVAP